MTRPHETSRWRLFLPLLLLLAGTVSLPSQTLRGTVAQKDTKAPLSSVNVYLKDTKFGTVTDSLGRFELTKFPLGVYVAEVRRIGFRTNRYILTIDNEDTIILTVELEVEPVPVEGVEIAGDAAKARQLSTIGKTIITADQVKQTGTKSLSTFLKSRYPGLFPLVNRRTYERLRFTLYVNGALVQYTWDVLDSMIDIEQLDYIEVYRSFGLSTTSNRGSNERVIHIHTKIPDFQH